MSSKYSGAEKAAFATVAIIVILKLATVALYFVNIYDVVTKPQYQTATVPNVICGIGLVPLPQTYFIGAAC